MNLEGSSLVFMADFKPTKKQWEALQILNDDMTTEIGWGGAAGGGKSFLGCAWIVINCLQYPGVGYCIARRELVSLKKTTIITLFDVFRMLEITEDGYKYNQQDNVITFNNGSQIFLMDLANKPSDPLFTRLGGLELTGVFIDESNECPAAGIEILKTRIGRRMNKEYSLIPKILETFNPSKNHVYQKYYKPWKAEELPEYRVFIKALATDNPHLDEHYIEQLKKADKVTRERLLNGNFEYDDDPTVLMKHDAVVDLFTNTIIKNGQKYISADVARFGKDSTVIMVWDGLEVVDIEIIDKSPTDYVATVIKEKARAFQVPYSQVIIDSDGIGGGVVDQLTGVKSFIANSTPANADHINSIAERRKYGWLRENYANLKSQCYFKLAQLVNQHKVAIKTDDPRIKETIIEELGYVKQKDPGKEGKIRVIPKDQIKEELGRSPDFADTLMMRMWFELRKFPDKGFTGRKNYVKKGKYGNIQL